MVTSYRCDFVAVTAAGVVAEIGWMGLKDDPPPTGTGSVRGIDFSAVLSVGLLFSLASGLRQGSRFTTGAGSLCATGTTSDFAPAIARGALSVAPSPGRGPTLGSGP